MTRTVGGYSCRMVGAGKTTVYILYTKISKPKRFALFGKHRLVNAKIAKRAHEKSIVVSRVTLIELNRFAVFSHATEI